MQVKLGKNLRIKTNNYAHVVQWISHSDDTCGRAWHARSPLFGGSIRASVW